MGIFYGQIKERRHYLKTLLKDISGMLKDSPDGKLRISCEKGKTRYYHITKLHDTNGSYISKKSHELALRLAQKDYRQRLYKKASEELEYIDGYIRDFGEEHLEQVFSGMNDYRKEIITPLAVPDKMFVSQWENEQYETNPFMPEEKVYLTKRDEKVRSKSELMLADMYCELGIPYRYEAALYLRGGRVKYPDFTILKVKTREIIFHEHMGMIDDPDYLSSAISKLDEYRKNGIYPGKNLLITYESKESYLNIKEIRSMVRDIILG
ncbi:MAG: hypothetical protein ACI4EU_00185 [Butyrivibrio sp.]